MSGTLYLVPTPIGNLGDISPRMAQTMAQADFIAAEDTRVTMKLLNHLELKKPMVSYYRHNSENSGQSILQRLLAGENCALLPMRAPPLSPTRERTWWPCAPRTGCRWCPFPVPAPWLLPWRPRASPRDASLLRGSSP